MSFLDQLSPTQRDAVQALDGPVMIVAGAGSGKTRVLTYRAALLVENGIRPESILALTFTNKAAGEMKARIANLVGEGSRAIWMGTFHSLFARILRWECERLGYGRSFTIYDTDDSMSLIRTVMSGFGISPQQLSPQGVRARISGAKNQLLTPAQLRETGFDPALEQVATIYEEYDARLRRSNAMDFDDLLLNPLSLFTRFPDVLERYQARFSHILVDEYQDTNRVQYRLITLLANRRRNLCVVGDDAQSIYRFRGADIRNILDFEKEYPDCRIFRLEQNYRSTKNILAAADSLIRKNVHQIPKRLWTDNDPGDLVMVVPCATDREEGAGIVRIVEEETRRRKLALNDFAVLYRTNAQSRSLEDALRRNGIPYLIVGGTAFYRRKEIKDILAYLRLLINTKDDESLIRVMNVPTRGIGETSLRRLRTLGEKKRLPLFDLLSSEELADLLTKKAAAAAGQLHALIAKYAGLRGTVSVSELARTLVDEIGILVSLKEENTPDSLSRRENILELVSALSEFQDREEGATLEQFLEEVSLVSDIDGADFSRNAVTLMTLHAAKGLEFPVVCIAGLEEGLFPLGGAVEEGELEEERRLLYVGITRAMQKLYLLWAQQRYRAGTLSFSTRSRFLDEIDPAVLSTARPRQGSRPSRPGPVPVPVPVSHLRAHTPPPRDPDAMPAYEDESQEVPALDVGTLVLHETFGKGRVFGLTGRGDQARAVVDFPEIGRKTLLLKFAHLKILS